MGTYHHRRTVFAAILLLGTLTTVSHAEQWNGSQNPNGAISRPGSVALGFEPSGGKGTKPLLEIQRPLTGDEDVLLSLRSTFRDAVSTVFQVDTKRVYIGGAANKSSLVPDEVYDLAVGRGIAIGLNSLTERLPTDYKLVVGGGILAEEVRIKQIKDWADYVFQPDYQLKTLPEVEGFIRAHHHLPDIPSASEAEQQGIGLGDMQATLLRKIEELTLHMIEQHKTIESLQQNLARLEDTRSRSQSHKDQP